MDALAAPIVHTKLRVPAARARTIPRARLVERLAGERGPGLTLVCAPAGYGKTTLLAEWARALLHGGTVVAWYALDPGDDAPIPFAAYLTASLSHAYEWVAGPIPELAQLSQLLRASPEIDLQQILPALVNSIDAGGKPCVLILDDFHLISSPVIHRALAYLLDHCPENLRIAIGSRANPPLPLGRLRARGQLLEIRAAQLRFQQDETAQFLNETMRLGLSAQGVTVLKERTEGWIAGLQLAALALQAQSGSSGGTGSDCTDGDLIPAPSVSAAQEALITSADFNASFSGGHRYLAEYLLEEVVDRLPEEAQWFLLATATLERMCAPLCDALVGSAPAGEALPGRSCRSADVLAQLEQANLFIVALDDQGAWYRYHHLFRDFLRSQLKRAMPERIPTLHRAAAEWLAENQFLREAAYHAFQTQDWEYAADFVERHSFTLITLSEISTLHEWCSAFPEPVMQRHPMLYVLQCWAWVLSYSRKNRERVEQRLRQAEQATAAQGNPITVAEIAEHAAVVRTFLVMAPNPAADPTAQLAAAQAMLAGSAENEPGQFSSLLITGYAQMALHDAQSAAEALKKARLAALNGALYFGVVEATFHLARIAQAQGRLREAEQFCREGLEQTAALLAGQGQGLPGQTLPALGCLEVALGCVLLELNQLAEAESHLLHGLERAGRWMNAHYLMTASVALFRLYQALNRPEEALTWLTRLETAWPDIAFCTRGLRAVHALRSAPSDPLALAEAGAWLREYTPEETLPAPGMGPFGAAEVYYLARLAWIQVQIACGSPETAQPVLEQQLHLSEAHGLTTRVIELTLLEAQRLSAAGEQDSALAALERALALGQPEGYLRIFDQGLSLNRLLSEAHRRGIRRAEIERILAANHGPAANRHSAAIPGEKTGDCPSAAASGAPAAQPPALALAEPLSERELEVLRLIARGATNQAIAEELVITVGTVKSHINHILGKLGCQNRTEAAARAREAGLIER